MDEHRKWLQLITWIVILCTKYLIELYYIVVLGEANIYLSNTYSE